MRTLALKDGDIYFNKCELAMVEGLEELDQNISVLMKINKGEWFLDLNEGLDYQLLFDKMETEDIKREEIYNRLMSDSRISSVESIDFHHDRGTRLLDITFKAVTTDGTEIEGEVVTDA